MEKTVLEEIVEKLSNRYGSGRHFEIIYADKKCDGTWALTVKEIKDETDKSEEEQ